MYFFLVDWSEIISKQISVPRQEKIEIKLGKSNPNSGDDGLGHPVDNITKVGKSIRIEQIKEMGDKAPENVKVIPDILDGEATYALEMLDEQGNPMKVYMTEDGVMMRLSNGDFLDKPLTAEEATQKIAQF